jgi:ribosomal protein L7Ae-like RNA K-turn-binding protein
VESLGEQLLIAADRRIEGLLAGARRGKLAIAGSDVVRAACREGTAALVLVASDAAAAAKLPEVQEAIGHGKAIVFSNKQRLGAIFGRDEVAVCAVLHEGVAKAIGSARRMALPFAGARSEAWSSEVR